VVIPPCSIVTASSSTRNEPYIRASNYGRLLPADTERRIRESVAYNVLVGVSGGRDAHRLAPGGESLPLYNMFAVTVAGSLANVAFARSVTFYLRPWGPPILGAGAEFRLRIAHNTFVHNSTQILATGGNIEAPDPDCRTFTPLLPPRIHPHSLPPFFPFTALPRRRMRRFTLVCSPAHGYGRWGRTAWSLGAPVF